MNNQAGDLRIQGNNYYVQDKKCFSAYASILDEDKKECFDFAYDMSYAKKGEHRDSRSGVLFRTLNDASFFTLNSAVSV